MRCDVERCTALVFAHVTPVSNWYRRCSERGHLTHTFGARSIQTNAARASPRPARMLRSNGNQNLGVARMITSTLKSANAARRRLRSLQCAAAANPPMRVAASRLPPHTTGAFDDLGGARAHAIALVVLAVHCTVALKAMACVSGKAGIHGAACAGPAIRRTVLPCRRRPAISTQSAGRAADLPSAMTSPVPAPSTSTRRARDMATPRNTTQASRSKPLAKIAPNNVSKPQPAPSATTPQPDSPQTPVPNHAMHRPQNHRSPSRRPNRSPNPASAPLTCTILRRPTLAWLNNAAGKAPCCSGFMCWPAAGQTMSDSRRRAGTSRSMTPHSKPSPTGVLRRPAVAIRRSMDGSRYPSNSNLEPDYEHV